MPVSSKPKEKQFSYRTKQVIDPQRFRSEADSNNPGRAAFRALFGEQVGIQFLDLMDKSITSALDNGAETVIDDDGTPRNTFIREAESCSQEARVRFMELLANHPNVSDEWLGQLCLTFYRLGLNVGSHNEQTKYEQPINKGFEAKKQAHFRGVAKGSSYEKYRQPCRDMATELWGRNSRRSLADIAGDIQDKFMEAEVKIGVNKIKDFIGDLNPRKKKQMN